MSRRPKDQRRIPISARLAPAIHLRLVASAHEHGRSLTQELEFRIERSFDDELVRLRAAAWRVIEAADLSLVEADNPAIGLCRTLAEDALPQPKNQGKGPRENP